MRLGSRSRRLRGICRDVRRVIVEVFRAVSVKVLYLRIARGARVIKSELLRFTDMINFDILLFLPSTLLANTRAHPRQLRGAVHNSIFTQ
jgi:hypothetical protein